MLNSLSTTEVSPQTYPLQSQLLQIDTGDLSYRTLNGVSHNTDGSLNKTIADGWGNFDSDETCPPIPRLN